MHVLVIENFDNTGLGRIAPALEQAGATLDRRRAHRGEPLPTAARGHDALVVLGGGQSALDDEAFPHLPPLLDLLREFVAADRAVLGVCLGAQLLARALGGANQLGAAPEFGWRNVALTAAGRADPVLGQLPDRFPIFEWHDDTFTLPPGAVHLAENAAAANQAFRVGRAAYGMQFHFEADRFLVREWNDAFADIIKSRYPDWHDRFDREADTHGPLADASGSAIARAWVAQI